MKKKLVFQAGQSLRLWAFVATPFQGVIWLLVPQA
jgi:hypothetical protein